MASTYFFLRYLLVGVLLPVAIVTTDTTTIANSITTTTTANSITTTTTANSITTTTTANSTTDTNTTDTSTTDTAPATTRKDSTSAPSTKETSSPPLPSTQTSSHTSSSPTELTTTPTTSPSTTTPTTVPSTTTTGGTATRVSNGGGTLASTSTSPATTGTATVVISETNLLLGREEFFIELSGNASASLDGFTLAVYDAVEEQPLWNVSFSAQHTIADKGLFVQNVTELPKLQEAVAVVLFKTVSYKHNFSLSEGGIQSHMVFSVGSSSIGPAFAEIFRTGKLFVLNITKLNITSEASLSLSACDRFPDYPTLTFSSRGEVNNCSLFKGRRYTVELTNTAKSTEKAPSCINLTSNLTVLFAEKINDECQCGLHPGLITPDLESCAHGDYNISFRFSAAVQEQLNRFQENYQYFIKKNKNITIGGSHFTLKPCSNGNCGFPPYEPLGKDGKISVTVAVVLSCIAVFCVILIGVIIYMRRKRRTILQFRMTRLHEDDDMMGDMDDFVGSSDKEPSFTNSRYSLTT